MRMWAEAPGIDLLMVASATTIVATAVYASSRLLNHGKSLPPWKRANSPAGNPSKVKQADSGLDGGKPGRQAAQNGEDRRGRSEGCEDAAAVGACAATIIHTCITDLSMPLWNGLEVHADTWVSGGASAQQRTLAVIAPPNETEGFLRTLCGMGEHDGCEGNLITFEPGWPSAMQLYPTLSCVDDDPQEHRLVSVVAVLDDGGEARALGAAQERREAISREVKAHCDVAVLVWDRVGFHDLEGIGKTLERIHSLVLPPDAPASAQRKGRASSSVQGGCEASLRLVQVVVVVPGEEIDEAGGREEWQARYLRRLMAYEASPKGLSDTSGSWWFWEHERVRGANRLRSEIRARVRVRVSALVDGRVGAVGGLRRRRGVESMRRDIIGQLVGAPSEWDAQSEAAHYALLPHDGGRSSGGGDPSELELSLSRIVPRGGGKAPCEDADGECDELAGEIGEMRGDWGAGGSLVM